MDHQEAMDFLLKNGNLDVPCSRYGRNTLECAEVAYQIDFIVCDANGTEMDEDTLYYAMGMVVNDHPDVANLLRENEYVLDAAGLSLAYREPWTLERAADYLVETGVITEDEMALVTSINGYNLETMEAMLYSRLGYRSFEQMEDEK